MRGFVIFLFVSVAFFSPLQAQTLDEAKKLYLDGKYAEAMPAFEKAIKASPKNASYNQWYGTCLLETGSVDKAESYLKLAASKDIPEAFNALGKLYFIQYRFEESTDAYEEYMALQKKKKVQDGLSKVDSLLNISKRAERMLSRCENIQIIDSVIVNKKDFLSKYLMSEEAGTIKMLPEFPGTVVYENQLKDRRYYSKPDKNNRFKMYSQTELQGNWSDEKLLSLPFDSAANDNYPYLLSDGVTVYFASTGRESIGGYDLYATRYNMNNGNYLAPEQLGMPFNSPYNDYMLVIDEFNGVGYFATDRFQSPDHVVIYTYIPNEEIKTIPSENQDTLISRAKIASIKDTWLPHTNYQAMLQKIISNTKKVKPEKKKDFIFVINDNILYYTLNDFESSSAKQLFVQSQNLKKQMENLEKQLDTQRQDYAKGNKSRASLIISNENEWNKLYDEYDSTLMKARNTEIKYLRQQQ